MSNKHFPHDSTYKDMFSFPSMVESLLLDFLPSEFVRDFDFSTLTPARASFVREDSKQLHSDVIWQFNWRGTPSLLVILRGELARTSNELAEIGEEFINRHLEPDAASLDRAVATWLEMRIGKVEPNWRSCKDKEQPKMAHPDLAYF